MIVENLSTNVFTFVAGYPDGSSQSVHLLSGAIAEVTSVSTGTNFWQDTFDTNWMIINDVSGLMAHGLISPSAEFLQGFFDVAPFTAILACVWLIRRAMSTSTSGYSMD